MKKLLLTASILSVASLGFSAEKLSLDGGGTAMDTSSYGGQTYSQININVPTNSEDGFAGLETTETITVQNSSFCGQFNPTAANAYINVDANYKFSGAVVLDCTSTDTGKGVMSVNVNNGATIEFVQGITAMRDAGKIRFRFGTEGDKNGNYMKDDTVKNGNVILNAVTGSVVNSQSTVTSAELILSAVNFTVKNDNAETNDKAVNIGSYVHLLYGTELKLETNVTLSVLNPRSARVGENVAGTVKLNGHTMTAGSVNFNIEAARPYGDLLIDMSGDNSKFICNGDVSFTTTKNNNWFDDYHFDFTNFDYESGDRILFANKLTDTVLSKMSINNLTGENILYLGKEGNYHSYSVAAVPEPAEWAMIFGAIALGFVAYRRRK